MTCLNSATIDVVCSKCHNLAKFDEPFEFLNQKEFKALYPQLEPPHHKWGGWVVIEKFPSEVSWQAPSKHSFANYLRGGGDSGAPGYPLLTHGLVRCNHCFKHTKQTLNWPKNAFWQFEIRGEVLWAWDKVHAKTILQFVKDTKRRSRKGSEVLRYIPSHFLTAKVRDEVVQKMEQRLNQQT